jgi:hypothetical protein
MGLKRTGYGEKQRDVLTDKHIELGCSIFEYRKPEHYGTPLNTPEHPRTVDYFIPIYSAYGFQ